MVKKSQITFLIATILFVAILAPVFATQVSAERSFGPKTVQGSMDNRSEKAGSIADINATRGNISQSIDMMRIGQYKLTYYKQVISKSELLVTNISKLGIDTSGMESVIEGAQLGVIEPLDTAVASGNRDRVANELKTKCLSNATSYSYHYGSKMDLEMMKTVTTKIDRIVTIAGYGTEIKEVKTHLANAEKVIDSVGTRPYTPEKSKYIYTELMSASSILVEIVQSMNEKAGY